MAFFTKNGEGPSDPRCPLLLRHQLPATGPAVKDWGGMRLFGDDAGGGLAALREPCKHQQDGRGWPPPRDLVELTIRNCRRQHVPFVRSLVELCLNMLSAPGQRRLRLPTTFLNCPSDGRLRNVVGFRPTLPLLNNCERSPVGGHPPYFVRHAVPLPLLNLKKLLLTYFFIIGSGSGTRVRFEK